MRAGEGLEKSGETYQVDLKKALEDGNPDSDDGGDTDAVSNDDGSLSETRDSDERRGDEASRADPSKTKKDRRVSRVLARGDGVKLTNTHREMVDLQNATEISLEVPDRVGLLADVCQCLVRNNVSVVNAHIYTTSDGLASNYILVRDAATNERVRDEVLEEMEQAAAARCHMRPGKKRSARRPCADAGGRRRRRRRLGNPAVAESSLTSEGVGSPSGRFPSVDGDPRGGPLVSQYAPEATRKKGEGMVRAHGGEVLEHDYDTQRRLLASKNVKHADLTKIEPIDVAALDARRHVVAASAANGRLFERARALATFPSAKKEIFARVPRCGAGPVGATTLAVRDAAPVPNLYVILEGALHREAFLRHGKTPVPTGTC